jgi:carbamoyl-phosphate synthase large subunit
MASETMTLLVLGVGGNVSQGILKALAASSLDCRVIGGCVDARSMGLYVCDHALVSPFASDPHFVDWLADICRKFNVAGILCGVEPVLDVLAKSKTDIENRTGAKIIVSPSEALAICGDKLLTANWLQEHGLNFPRSVDAQDNVGLRHLLDECAYPLFAKPRDGKSSQGIMKIASDTDLSAVMEKPNYVIQEYLGTPAEEFTAATFSDNCDNLRGCIVFRRQLLEGTTVSAEVVHAPEVRSEVLAIAEELKPVGPCNMQLRLVDDRPVCFEINLRYSGTTPIRAHFGFNDVEAGVRHYVLGEPAYALPDIRQGVALRFWNEIYIDHRALDVCARAGELSAPRQAVTHFESIGRGK